MSEVFGIGGIGAARAGGIDPFDRLRERAGIGGVAGSSFADTLKDALGEVSAMRENSAEKVGAFLRGEPVELHQVMAAAEESGIALEMLVEVRNKLMEAYQTLVNMQS